MMTTKLRRYRIVVSGLHQRSGPSSATHVVDARNAAHAWRIFEATDPRRADACAEAHVTEE